MNPQNFLLHPPSLNLQPIKLKSYLSIATNNNGRRKRRRRPAIGPFKITPTSFKRAVSFAISLRDLFSKTSDPLNLLLLHYGGGGGGGRGLGLPTGGAGGEWFGKRRRGRFKLKGMLGFLLFSIAVASMILEFGEKKRAVDLELGARVLVPAVLGFKIRVWRHWIWLSIGVGLVFCVLLRRSREKNRTPWLW